MAYGRQRKRAVLLAKKEAERKAKAGLTGLNPEALASVVSDDTNDLDNVSYTTTGGATVSVKNDRNKEVTPSVSILGGRKGFKPGQAGEPNEPMMSAGPASRSARGFSFDDELLLQGGPSVRGSAKPKQAAALTDFIGEDLSLNEEPTNSKFVTVPMDSEEDKMYAMDNSVLGEKLNDDGTVTYELPESFGDMREPQVTTNELTEAQLEPTMYDNVQPGQERALTPTLDNKGYGFDANGNIVAEQSIMHNPSDEQRAAAGLSLEEQLKEQELLRQLEQETRDSNNALLGDDTTTELGRGSLENQSVGKLTDGSAARMAGDVPGYQGAETEKVFGVDTFQKSGNAIDEGLDENVVEGDKENKVFANKTMDEVIADQQAVLPTEFSEADIMDGYSGEEKAQAPKAAGSSTVGEIAEEVKSAEADIQAAQAGNPHLDAITTDAKAVVEDVKTSLEQNKMTAEEAAKVVKNSLGQLGELLGIDGKDLVRGLMRYAGARIFGMSGNQAGRFMYEGFMADSQAEAKALADEKANMGLGADATSGMKNLAAYRQEMAIIEDKLAKGEITEKEAEEDKWRVKATLAGEKQQRVTYYNIRGVRPDGTQDTVEARTNVKGEQEIKENGVWIPSEESNLTDTQMTTKSNDQPFERGVVDPRIIKEIDAELAAGKITAAQAEEYKKNANIPNASRVDSTGTPAFHGKFKNETESDSYNYALRMVDAQPAIDIMLKDPEMVKQLGGVMAGIQQWGATHANDSIGAAGINNLLSENNVPRRFRPLASMWLQGLLRKDTGAAYSGYEYNDYLSGFMPVSGDNAGDIEQKRLIILQMTRNMAANAGAGSAYLMGRMDGRFRAPTTIQKIVDNAIGNTAGGSTTSSSFGLSAEEEAAWNAYQ